MRTVDIPLIPSRIERIREITVNCDNQLEELAAFEAYFVDALQPPFAAIWRDPDEPGHAEPVTVLGLAEVDERRGVLLKVRRGPRERRLLSEQVWAEDRHSPNGVILDDYRYWVERLGGLTPGYG
ncbi:MAG: calcium-binding protein [Anaerolineales bacterium]